MSKYEAVYFVGDNQAINRVRVDSSKTRNRGAFSGSLAALMVTDLVLELDYPFLHISALEDVYINSALYRCFLLTYLPYRSKIRSKLLYLLRFARYL